MASVTLCFDFGNTRLKCGVFEDDSISEVIVLENDRPETLLQLIEKFHPQRTILASVIDPSVEGETLLASHSTFHKVSHLSKLPFTASVVQPETIGADRVALAAAAAHFYPSVNNLIIGMGSCITYNFINKYKQYLGGAISPGMEMRFTSLKTFTAKLPLVHPDWNFPLVGYDTRTNILSGVMLGMAKEIDGVIEEYQKRYSNFNVLLTGGDAPYFAAHLKSKIFADPDLIFKGLYAISEYNDIKT